MAIPNRGACVYKGMKIFGIFRHFGWQEVMQVEYGTGVEAVEKRLQKSSHKGHYAEKHFGLHAVDTHGRMTLA